MNIEVIKEYLSKHLSEGKFIHSVNVAEEAQELARRFGINSNDAYLAGILHDIARDIASPELLDIAKKNDLIGHSIEEKMPVVLHANVGAFIISQRLKIKKKNILQAVHNHTVAASEMTKLDKIIYLADVIEPERSFEGIEFLRELAKKDLDEAFLSALDGTIAYLISKRSLIHPFTIQARNKIIEGVKISC